VDIGPSVDYQVADVQSEYGIKDFLVETRQLLAFWEVVVETWDKSCRMSQMLESGHRMMTCQNCVDNSNSAILFSA
jgi:hypothetical protein